ncbi:hypothetical protein RUM43_003146 [Polyplax serrata]|uniref:Triple functional domain protein n=1 Tax=Polyplax serrata TaxID=468196 RepID=A0AAN8NZP6_POLSC
MLESSKKLIRETKPPRILRKFVRSFSAEPGTSDGSGGHAITNSPVNKRRVFSGRKWLPPPLRKLSQGKVDKNNTSDRSQLKKTPSDKRFRLPSIEMGNKQGSTAEEEESTGRLDNDEEGEEDAVELPPPMKPIQEPLLVPTEDTQGQREQHTENQERNSTLSRDSKVSSDVPSGGSETSDRSSVETQMTNPEDAKMKRDYVIRELVDTEKDYVRDLGLVVDGYMAIMRSPDCDIPMPEDLRGGKDKMVFGNIEAIYEWHKNRFLVSLEECIEHPEKLGPLFKKYERKLHMYVVYCQNKPVSEYIVSEYIDTYFEELRQKLGHKLTLGDLLIKPVQRIMKYQLLLRDIAKYTQRADLKTEMEDLRVALQVMHVVPKSANDMMDVGRLQGFDGKITAQGKLLLHGLLMCSEVMPAASAKAKELQVFLFEQNIIFSEAVGKKTQFTDPMYIYKAHIQVNKVALDETYSDDPEGVKFVIISTDRKKTPMGFVCAASTRESRNEWVATIKNILQTQKDFLKAIQSPIAYQKELTKET